MSKSNYNTPRHLIKSLLDEIFGSTLVMNHDKSNIWTQNLTYGWTMFLNDTIIICSGEKSRGGTILYDMSKPGFDPIKFVADLSSRLIKVGKLNKKTADAIRIKIKLFQAKYDDKTKITKKIHYVRK